jgi:hypothetical protein
MDVGLHDAISRETEREPSGGPAALEAAAL